MRPSLFLPAALAFVSLLPLARAVDMPDDATAIFPAAGGTRVRIEAFDTDIVRIWVQRPGQTERRPSFATDAAPAARAPLSIREGEAVDPQAANERQSPSSASTPRIVADTGALSIDFDPATLRFSVADSAGSSRSREATAAPVPLLRDGAITLLPGKPEWSLTASLPTGEEIFGLGQDNHNNGRLNRRGVIRDLWAGQQINSGNVTAQYPVPFEIDVLPDGRAFGVFYDNVFHLTYDLGHTKPDQYRLDAAGGDIDFYIIDGPRIADVIERYTRLTGRPSLPPLWVLGYWQSKCTYYDWQQLDEAYDQLHARGFPVDVMVIDADWPEIQNDFQWAKRWFTEGKTPAQRIAAYAKEGVHIVMSQSGPMIRQESPTFASGWKLGVFATDGHGNPVECGYYGGKLLDFTSPHLDEWLWPQVKARIADGVSGWWLDLTEPEGEPPQTVYHAGPAASIHNEYSLLSTISFEGVQLDAHPDRRPWVLTRAGSAGLQRHHAAVWTGDIYSDYATLRAHPPEMLNSGLSGLDWWTCDTGGFLEGYYRNDQMGAHARLYQRWMEFSAFSPITRAHKAGGVPEPYRFGPAVEESLRHYLKLRYRLIPYIYSYAWQASQTGLPLVRPLALEYQDDAQSRATPGDEYLFGRELLVAPVLFEGVTNRDVYFPPGTWYDWDTGVEYAGGRKWVVAAPPNRIPVAVRAGAIIPMAPDMLTTREKPWDPITLEIFPAGRSDFTLYHDDGATFGYEHGAATVTTIKSDESAREVRLSIDESNKQFVPETYALRLHLNRRPAHVTASDSDDDSKGREIPFTWDEATRVAQCNVASGAALQHGVIVELDAQVLPARLASNLKLDVPNAKSEAAGSSDTPTPHFFPAPSLPARIQAANYDNGGEGVAYHRGAMGERAEAQASTTAAHPKSVSVYRPDDIGVAPTNDAGGGYVLAFLEQGDWVRYSIDAGNGGYFGLSARVAWETRSSAKGGTSPRLRLVEGDRDVAVIDVPETGGADYFTDVQVPLVYLNPGVHSLMVYVDVPGAALHSFAFAPVSNPPAEVPAAFGLHEGPCEVTSAKTGVGHPVLDKFGRHGSSVTVGLDAPAGGAAKLRVRYRNASGKPVAVSIEVGGAPAVSAELPVTGDQWSDAAVSVALHAGGNKVVLRGRQDDWSGVTLDTITRTGP